MSTPLPRRYVGDSSILAQSVIKGPHSPRVDTLLAGLVSQPPAWELWTPDFYLIECANALWKEVRFHGLPQADARSQLSYLTHLAIKITPSSALISRALDIGMAQMTTVYDALYIALADSLSCELITDDAKQATAAKALGVKLTPITDFPPLAAAP